VGRLRARRDPLPQLARAARRGDSIAEERSSSTWTTRSFASYYGQLLSIAVNIGGAMEIERALGKSDA